MDTGADVFVRDNGAFDYLELALPDDTMVFQDAVGGNGGVAGGAGVQTLFWVVADQRRRRRRRRSTRAPAPIRLAATIRPSSMRTPIRASCSLGTPSASRRAAPRWRRTRSTSPSAARDRSRTSAPIIRCTWSGSTARRWSTSPARRRRPIYFSPVVVSDDGADVYYFQTVDTQDSRGTLMHLAATAGATPAEDRRLGVDHRRAPGAGRALVRAERRRHRQQGRRRRERARRLRRDGARHRGADRPARPCTTPTGGGADLAERAPDAGDARTRTSSSLDGARALVGALELTTASGNDRRSIRRCASASSSCPTICCRWSMSAAPPSTRPSTTTSARCASSTTATPTMKAPAPISTGVSEVGPVVKRSLFVNAPKAPTPGVYFVNF